MRSSTRMVSSVLAQPTKTINFPTKSMDTLSMKMAITSLRNSESNPQPIFLQHTLRIFGGSSCALTTHPLLRCFFPTYRNKSHGLHIDSCIRGIPVAGCSQLIALNSSSLTKAACLLLRCKNTIQFTHLTQLVNEAAHATSADCVYNIYYPNNTPNRPRIAATLHRPPLWSRTNPRWASQQAKTWGASGRAAERRSNFSRIL